ncbi:hypothetical protein SDJN03_07974, partial [Cucurbita argyrosperma subsp. sororia]
MDSPYCHKINVEVNHPTSPSLQRQNFRCPKGAKRVEVKGLSIVPDARGLGETRKTETSSSVGNVSSAKDLD